MYYRARDWPARINIGFVEKPDRMRSSIATALLFNAQRLSYLIRELDNRRLSEILVAAIHRGNLSYFYFYGSICSACNGYVSSSWKREAG